MVSPRSIGIRFCLRKDLLRFAPGLLPQRLGKGVLHGRRGADRSKIFIGGCLCSLKHPVQLQRRLRDGTGVFNVDLAVGKLLAQRGIFCFQLIFALLEGKDDLN